MVGKQHDNIYLKNDLMDFPISNARNKPKWGEKRDFQSGFIVTLDGHGDEYNDDYCDDNDDDAENESKNQE